MHVNPIRWLSLILCASFSAIYIELYYVFASVWGHQLYSLYGYVSLSFNGWPPDSDIAVLLTGILMLVFMILIIVTSFITIALTYFQVPCLRFVWGPKLVSWSIFRHILQS